MKISIVTPAYNGAKWLPRCIESVLGQELAEGDELEYRVADGGSRDGTVELLESYGDRLSGWTSEPDQGPADALNRAFTKCGGEMLGWLNADDAYRPGALKAMSEAAKRHPGKAIYFGKCRIVNPAGEEIRGFPTFVKNACFPFSSRFLIRSINYLSQPSSWFRREAWERAGGRIRTDWKAAWDYDLTLRLWAHGGGRTIPGEALADFTWHPGSISGSQYERQFDEELAAALEDAGRWSLPGLLHRGVRAGILFCYRRMNRAEEARG